MLAGAATLTDTPALAHEEVLGTYTVVVLVNGKLAHETSLDTLQSWTLLANHHFQIKARVALSNQAQTYPQNGTRFVGTLWVFSCQLLSSNPTEGNFS